jgi:hypothetical protein
MSVTSTQLFLFLLYLYARLKVDTLIRLNSDGWLLALPTDSRLGRKELSVKNTLAYYIMAKITAVKSFID